jgi:prepilin-type N-terminal cleavage/methylation domain-containing protein
MRFHRSGDRSSAAYTLIEVLVALVILSLGLLGLVSSFSYNSTVSEYSRRLTVATQTADSAVGEMRALGYWKLAPGAYDLSAQLPETLHGGSMTAVVSNWATEVKRVEVTVTWRPGTRTGGSVELSTLVGRTD